MEAVEAQSIPPCQGRGGGAGPLPVSLLSEVSRASSPTQQPQGGVGEVFGGGWRLAAWAREAGTKGRPPEQGRGPP